MAFLRRVNVTLPKKQYSQTSLSQVLYGFMNKVNPSYSQTKGNNVEKIFQNACIKKRHFLFDPDNLHSLSTIEKCQDDTIHQMSSLSTKCIKDTLKRAEMDAKDIDHVFSLSGFYCSPPLDAYSIHNLPFRSNVKRTPMVGLGCAGGVSSIAHAFDYLKSNPSHAVLTSSVESGSRYWLGAIQSRLLQLLPKYEQNAREIMQEVVVASLCADAAGCTVLVGPEHKLAKSYSNKQPPIPKVIDSRSQIVPDSLHLVGCAPELNGFRIWINSHVPEVMTGEANKLAMSLLEQNGLTKSDISHWYIHPGGPKVLRKLAEVTGLSDYDLRYSWRSLGLVGNCSSASVLHVLDLALNDPKNVIKSGQYGVMMSMGPGSVIESVLLKF